MTLRDIRPVEDVPLLLEDVHRPAPEMSVSGPWRHRTKDGDVIDVTISSHALSFDGRPARLVQAHNVTEELVKLSLGVEQTGQRTGGRRHDATTKRSTRSWFVVDCAV